MLERIFSKPIIKVVSRAKLLTIAHGKTLIGIELDGWGWLRISNPSEIKYKFFFFNNYLQLKVTQNQNIALCAFNLFGRTSQEINLDCVVKSYPVLPENVKSEIYAFTVDEQLSVINQNRALLQDKLNSSVIKYESFNGCAGWLYHLELAKLNFDTRKRIVVGDTNARYFCYANIDIEFI